MPGWGNPSKEVESMGSRVRWLQVLIIISALAGVLAVQSARPRHWVVTNTSGNRL
jgi:hypothetical protein